jgi:hypothetical protein
LSSSISNTSPPVTLVGTDDPRAPSTSTHYLDWCTSILFGWLCSWSCMCLHVYSKPNLRSRPGWGRFWSPSMSPTTSMSNRKDVTLIRRSRSLFGIQFCSSSRGLPPSI